MKTGYANIDLARKTLQSARVRQAEQKHVFWVVREQAGNECAHVPGSLR